MGIYLPDMEMPKNCDECYIREKDTCPLTKTNVTGWGIPLNCPLVPVPAHGRLGDLDELEKSFREDADAEWNRFATPLDWADAFDDVADIVADAPTIIPASKEVET